MVFFLKRCRYAPRFTLCSRRWWRYDTFELGWNLQPDSKYLVNASRFHEHRARLWRNNNHQPTFLKLYKSIESNDSSKSLVRNQYLRRLNAMLIFEFLLLLISLCNYTKPYRPFPFDVAYPKENFITCYYLNRMLHSRFSNTDLWVLHFDWAEESGRIWQLLKWECATTNWSILGILLRKTTKRCTLPVLLNHL